ncbi:MAG TPA: PLP-dependent aminotransferase family protein [Terriglobales bacterium]|nr:PLP-dependent aminotransferase family protein [Terriglobales bacterium]
MTAITPIIAIDRKARTPLHRQIYDGYRGAIVSGTLRPGQRVPSTRGLAADLNVSRIPVLGAYAQLMAEGYFQSRVGAGTAVSLSLPDQKLLGEPRPIHSSTARASKRPRKIAKRPALPDSIANPPWGRGWGAFAVGQVAADHFPFREWNRLVARHSRIVAPKSLDYGHPLGLKDLREALASYLRTARGVRCEADQIMIVSGSQQALDISARVLLDPGDGVWMEEPGYRYARFVFGLNVCRMFPIPVDDEGLNVSIGRKRYPNARAALVTPSHHYPLGVTISASRRLQLLDWAARSGSWILEDDYDSDYRYEGMPISSLQGLDSNSRVVYIGTFSKVLLPSLRLGYLVIPSDLVQRFLMVRLAMDIAPATFSQAVLADFIQEGHFSRHIRRMRLLYRERRNALVENIEKEFGGAAKVTGEQAGMHLCVVMDGILDREVVDRAARAGLWLVPLSSSYTQKPHQGFVLGFGSTPVKEMANAVRKLRAQLR